MPGNHQADCVPVCDIYPGVAWIDTGCLVVLHGQWMKSRKLACTRRYWQGPWCLAIAMLHSCFTRISDMGCLTTYRSLLTAQVGCCLLKFRETVSMVNVYQCRLSSRDAHTRCSWITAIIKRINFKCVPKCLQAVTIKLRVMVEKCDPIEVNSAFTGSVDLWFHSWCCRARVPFGNQLYTPALFLFSVVLRL